MKIGIIGSGNIGGNLGRAWSKKGHTIAFGVRDPGKIADLVAACPDATATDPGAATRFGEVVVLAVPYGAVADLAASLKDDLSGRVLIDATNPLAWDEHGPKTVVDDSGAERIAALCPGARVVKAFNSIGAEHLLSPRVGGTAATTYLCGDDPAARETVAGLARDLGFEAADLGPLRNARVAEHIAIAWIQLAMKSGLGRNIAINVVRGR